MPLETTAGRLFFNELLPPQYRNYNKAFNKKELNAVLTQIARNEDVSVYRKVLKQVNASGDRYAGELGGFSQGSQDLKLSDTAKKYVPLFRKAVDEIADNDNLSRKEKEEGYKEAAKHFGSVIRKELKEELKEKNHPLYLLSESGAKGNDFNLAAAVGADTMYVNSKEEALPFPVFENYGGGMSPLAYFAGSYGARAGVVIPKKGISESGALSKDLVRAVNRLVVTAEDADTEDPRVKYFRGLPSDIDDDDNVGRLLAQDVGEFKRNTLITENVVRSLKKSGVKDILVRSPIVGGPADGLYSRDIGITDKMRLAVQGENPSISAVQAIGEPLGQGMLSSKHTGGVFGAQAKSISGFANIKKMIYVPKEGGKSGWAAQAQLDGVVSKIEKAPAGGNFVYIGSEKHFIPADKELSVKVGEEVEAGDSLSSGIPNPAVVVEHKGIGAGRKHFTDYFAKHGSDWGLNTHKRNIEMLARGLVDLVEVDKETGNNVPGDMVPYSSIESSWEPREGAFMKSPSQAKGYYLEEPVLHYTIGTKVRPSVIRDLERYKVGQVTVHKEPAPFKPVMISGMQLVSNDQDWMHRLSGAYAKRSILEGVARGVTSDPSGASAFSAVAHGANPNDLKNKVHSPLLHLPDSHTTKPDDVGIPSDEAMNWLRTDG